MSVELDSLILKPIGIVKSSRRVKFDAPHQPDQSTEENCTIELFPGKGFDQGLQDLKGFDYIWLIWWFHKNQTWKPKVLPPRGSYGKRGVFATRAPHRPNPIGISAVQLIKTSGLKLTIGATDLIDGTPILDIKPYISEIDSFPSAKNGWLAEVEAELAKPPSYQVVYSALANDQFSWLLERKVNFIDRAKKILERNPEPHRTRRITKWRKEDFPNNFFRMGCGAWRLFFSIQNEQVIVHSVTPGYPLRLFENSTDKDIPDRSEQLDFWQIWPDSLKD
ncbi:MAG: tRNA (N6-threonylcarbamoyladenosine(37)-N6)-methyltransferase TrmO [bacterium]|nr:tRNA (N6-threonylcarbamoyladenosine(37)-N6)-methyltransferase TrmO [bacterium]